MIPAAGATWPSRTWYLIVEPNARPGAQNMALDARLLAEAKSGRAFLRLYRWSPPCLSLGRHEPALRRYQRDRILRNGIHVVRRPTGGRAVWHDREVTYAVAAPSDVFGSLRKAYITIHHMIADALRCLGAHVHVSDERAPPRPDAGACFATPVGGEIMAGTRKLVGSAQYREPDVMLQHGSILLENGQDILRTLSIESHDPVPATSLSEALGRHVTFAEAAGAVAAGAARSWGGSWIATRMEPDARDVALYTDPRWTWRR